MTAAEPTKSALMVGGPAHGRWFEVRRDQHQILVPDQAQEITYTLTPEDDPGLWYNPPKPIRYVPKDLFIFGRVVRVWVPSDLSDSALSDAAFDLLVSPVAKGAKL